MKSHQPRIVVALDYAEQQSALELVARLDPALCCLKIGSEMFVHFGPTFVTRLVKQGFSVFLDLKFHDIPNTVAKACLAAADLGVWMINVHAQGGIKMLAAAREALAKRSEPSPLLIGVTLLTSLDEQDTQMLGWQDDTNTIVSRLAKLCQQAGLDGVVCSAQEVRLLRQVCGENFCLVTPGIRLQPTQDDQQRTMKPQEAIAAGADYLVIGRPITQASNPLQVLTQIQEQI